MDGKPSLIDYQAQVEDFIDGVRTGRISAGRWLRLAVKRHILDLEKAGDRGYYFDPECAIEACEFSELCCLTKGEWGGQPMVLSPAQIFFIWCVFGWRRKSDGMRRFNRARLEVARKFGKSAFCSFLSLLLLAFDNPIETGCEGYAVATKEQQAIIVHSGAVSMVKQSPTLSSRLTINKNRIASPATMGFFIPIGSDSETTDGLDPHFIIRDEQHAWRERHRGLHQKLNTGSGARRQPLDITITTAGDDKSTIWMEERSFAEKVLESSLTGEIVADNLFALICSMDIRDYDCIDCIGDDCGHCDGTGKVNADNEFESLAWRKGNPNLGITVKLDWAQEQADEAKMRPEKRSELLRYVCNVKVASNENAIYPEVWKSCAGELSDLSGRDAFGGFDLGRSNDFAAVANVFPFDEVDDDGESFLRYEIWSQSFTSQDRPEATATEQIDRWIERGLLKVSSGDQVDFSDVEDLIVSRSFNHQVKTWAFDPTFALQMSQRLSNLHGLAVFSFTQSPRFYNEPLRKFLGLLTQSRIVNGERVPLIKHNGCPVLAWQAGNLVTVRNAKDELMPDKGGSPYKIDAMVAILMAFSEALYAESQCESSYYEHNSLAL